jgi:hypothetical protein
MNLTGERSRLLAFVLLLVAAFAVANLLFNLQNLILGPETLPDIGGDGREGNGQASLALPWESLRTLFFSIIIVLLSLLVIGVVYLKRKGEKGFFPVYELIGALVAVILILLLIIVIRNIGYLEVDAVGNRESGFSSYPEEPRILPRSSAAPIGLGIIGAGLLLILLGFVVSRWLSRRREEPVEDTRRRAMDRIADTIYRLELGDDVRDTILKCYADMLLLFRETGLRFGEYATARELEHMVMERLGLSSEAAVRLRELFEEARYSSHSLAPGYREAALKCLFSVREELESLRASPAT